MKIAILDDWFATLSALPCFRLLDGHDVTVFTDHLEAVEPLADRLAPFEALVLIRERTKIPAELIRRLPRLRLISQRSVFPHIDIDACTEHGIVVCSDLHVDTPCFAAAELTWGLVLAGCRQIPQQMAALQAGCWQTGIGHTLRGRRLGVLGYGRIGKVVAGYGRSFGMDVLVWGGEQSRAAANADSFAIAEDQRQLFGSVDVVTLHLRLHTGTRGIVTAADLAAMHPGALLVNTSRAGLIEPGALAAALRAGRPGFAAVDVYEDEPLRDTSHPMLGLDTVVCTPHVGYLTYEEWELQFTDVFNQINAFAAGSPVNVVNPSALVRSASLE